MFCSQQALQQKMYPAALKKMDYKYLRNVLKLFQKILLLWLASTSVIPTLFLTELSPHYFEKRTTYIYISCLLWLASTNVMRTHIRPTQRQKKKELSIQPCFAVSRLYSRRLNYSRRYWSYIYFAQDSTQIQYYHFLKCQYGKSKIQMLATKNRPEDYSYQYHAFLAYSNSQLSAVLIHA